MKRISKALQLEILSGHQKMSNAIRDHQILVAKHKEDPTNAELANRIRGMDFRMTSVARRQKQTYQRLRREVADCRTMSVEGVKAFIAGLLGLNNNDHTTANNESGNDDISAVSNGLDNVRLAPVKEDYEADVKNVEAPPRRKKAVRKPKVVPVEKPAEVEAVPENEQLTFLEAFGLTTKSKAAELQNKRGQRKRRSTTRPQFVYGNWDVPKEKRHCYLQSAGNVPQTRQTTARLKEPSPPLPLEEPADLVVPPKPMSPATRAPSKSLVPTQKATTRPNILRNVSESRVFPNKATVKTENENGHVPLTCTTTKTSQPTTNSKTVHIPGLPSGLTIERIENDSAVCINCRNPGILTNCDNCEANYHVSCHSLSPPPPRLCPKCALKTIEPTATIKKNDELATASYAPGVVGKAGKDPAVDKTSRGFYKIGTNSRHQIVGASSCINKLSGSTFLIPIVPNALPTSSSLPKSGGNIAGFDGSRLNVLEFDYDRQRGDNTRNLPYTRTILVNNHLSRSSVTYVPQADSTNVTTPYPYKFSMFNESKSLYESGEESRIKIELREGGENETRLYGNESRYQDGKNIKTVSGISDEWKESVSMVPTVGTAGKQQQQQLEKLTGRVAESLARGWKKSSTRAVPGLTRIVQSGEKREPIAFIDGNNDNVDELQKCSYNSRVRIGPQQSNNRRNPKAPDKRRDDDDSSDGNGKTAGFEVSGEPQMEIKGNLSLESWYAKYGPELGERKFHSLFPSHNEPDPFTDRVDQSKSIEGTTSVGKIGNTARGDDKNGSHDKATLADSSKPSKVVAPTEHVKLEEAHLSAPSRTKLIRKIDENEEGTLLTKINDSSESAVYRLLPNRRRTTEDRSVELYENDKFERRPMPRILMRSERKSLDSRNTLTIEACSRKIHDLPAFSKNYSSSFARLPIQETNLAKTESTSSTDTSATEEASSPSRTSDADSKTIERNEDDDSRNNTEADDEETDDNDEDVEAEEDQDCPIVDDEIREQGIEGLRISTVSPESMRILEQFESAMMKAENSDKKLPNFK